MQVSQLAAMWLEFKADEISASTLYTYERIARTRVCPMLGDRAIDSVEAVELQTLLMRALTDRSENEALKTRAVLRGMFGYAADLGLIDQSPAARIRLPRGTGNARAGIRRVPTLEDARQMSRHLDEAYSLMPLLAAFAGLRWQEVAALRPEDFETETRIITIERALGRHGGMKEPKSTAGRRKTIWAAETHDRIVSFLAHKDTQDWLFLSEKGLLLHYPNWRNRCWVPAGRQTGLGWTFHEYRHTFAVESLRRGRSVQSVSVMMGHSNPRVTWEFYAGLFEDHLDEARRAW